MNLPAAPDLSVYCTDVARRAARPRGAGLVPGARKDAWLRAAAAALEERTAEVLAANERTRPARRGRPDRGPDGPAAAHAVRGSAPPPKGCATWRRCRTRSGRSGPARFGPMGWRSTKSVVRWA